MQLPDMLQHVVFKQLSQHSCTAAKTCVKSAKGTAVAQRRAAKRECTETAAIRAGLKSHLTERPSSNRAHLSTATIDAFQLNLAQQEVRKLLLRIKTALL